jgi:hypothetical protein
MLQWRANAIDEIETNLSSKEPPMLITVKDSCILQDNALDVRVSDQIEQLDELITAEGNGAAFFARTHITAGKTPQPAHRNPP